jgi:multidrug resistance efflux pump
MSKGSVIPRPAALRFRDNLFRMGPPLVALVAALAVSLLWKQEVFPTNFVGEAQSPAAILVSPVDGYVVLNGELDLFSRVASNQVVGQVQVRSDAGVMREVAVLRADLEVMRMRLMQDQQRNDLNFLQSQALLQEHRLDLASARVNLRQAESELKRMEVLLEQGIVSAGTGDGARSGYDIALRNRDVLVQQIEDRERLVATLETGLAVLEPLAGTNALHEIHATISHAARIEEEALAKSTEPSLIHSPIDGMLTVRNHLSGDFVREGEELFEVRGESPEWILGYIRQPIAFRPEPGDKVRVMSRSRPRRIAEAKVLQVGSNLQPFAQPLRVRGFDASQERGLPVLIAYPTELELSAGELVDLVPITN